MPDPTLIVFLSVMAGYIVGALAASLVFLSRKK